MIDKDTIGKILSSIDPISIAMQYLSFKKQGKRNVALCPFHKEKTPSFFMNDEGVFHCFGCGKGGNFISFIMEMEKLNFQEAVNFLANKAGITIDKSFSTEAYRQRELLISIHREAALLFHNYLYSEDGKKALEYLKNRQISKETIDKFMIGYAPDKWDYIVESLSKKFDLVMIAKSGLIITNASGDGYYDRFRNRIMIPIFDLQENIVAFGGRTLSGDAAKYINSAESPIFQKSNILFGLNLAKKLITEKGYAILVEGYFDAISLHSFNFDNTVASLGTSLTENQVQLLKRYTSDVYICYDSDKAGKKATERAILLLLQKDLSIKVIILDENEDPDSFCKKFGKDIFQERIKKASDYIQFYFQHKIASYPKLTPRIKSSIVMEGIPILQAINNPIIKSHYVKTVSELLRIKEDTLLDSLQSYSPRVNYSNYQIQEREKIPIAEKIILLACLNESSILQSILISDTEEFFEVLCLSSIFEKLIQMLRNDEQITVESIMLNLGEEDQKILSSILMDRIEWENDNVIYKARAALKVQLIERKIFAIQEKIQNLTDEFAKEGIDDLLKEKKRLQEERLILKNLSK